MVQYDLTKLGKELMPTFKKLLTWGEEARGLGVVYAHSGALTVLRSQGENRLAMKGYFVRTSIRATCGAHLCLSYRGHERQG